MFMFLFVDITKSDDLKNHLMEGVDYELLPVEAWESLLNWYGMVDGSVPVPRIVQEHGQYVKSLKVEVYLTKLKLCRNSDMKDCVVKKFSRNATLGRYSCMCSGQKSKSKSFPCPVVHRVAPTSVSIALGHASANAVKATLGGWSTGSSMCLTSPLLSHLSSARREGSEYHLKSLW